MRRGKEDWRKRRRERGRKGTGEAHVGSYLKIFLYHLDRSVPSDRRQAVSPEYRGTKGEGGKNEEEGEKGEKDNKDQDQDELKLKMKDEDGDEDEDEDKRKKRDLVLVISRSLSPVPRSTAKLSLSLACYRVWPKPTCAAHGT